mmetsp:Transcript_10900/g.28615  ORF Transcript_10900/g.28615 Transcript_10900/m.28615 type:complete len:93 (+) Transcript_10900:214-492(+)
MKGQMQSMCLLSFQVSTIAGSGTFASVLSLSRWFCNHMYAEFVACLKRAIPSSNVFAVGHAGHSYLNECTHGVSPLSLDEQVQHKVGGRRAR